MAKGYEVLGHLLPDGGWVISGDDFDSIIYDDGIAPITKKSFDDAFAIVDSLKQQEKIEKDQAKQAILDRLGLTEEEFRTVIS